MKSILAVDNILDWSFSRYRLSLSWIVSHNRLSTTHESVAFCHPRGIYHPFVAGTYHCILVAKDQRVWPNVWHIHVCQEKSPGSPYAMKKAPKSARYMKETLVSIFLRSHNGLIHFRCQRALLQTLKDILDHPALLWWSSKILAATALLKVIDLEDGRNSSSSIGSGSPFLSISIPPFYQVSRFPLMSVNV